MSPNQIAFNPNQIVCALIGLSRPNQIVIFINFYFLIIFYFHNSLILPLISFLYPNWAIPGKLDATRRLLAAFP